MTTRRTASSDDELLAKLESVVDTRYHLPPALTVGEIMTSPVVACRASDTLDRCAQIMWDRDCGCVPVVDETNQPISVITDRDVCMAAWTKAQPLSTIPVASAMSSRLFTANLHDVVTSAEALMRRHCIRRLPVVDDSNQLIGILSIDDITNRGYVLADPVNKDPLSAQAIAGTVAALSHTTTNT